MQDMEPACLAIYRGMQRGKGVWAHESQRGFATIESSTLPYFSRSAGPIPETFVLPRRTLAEQCSLHASRLGQVCQRARARLSNAWRMVD